MTARAKSISIITDIYARLTETVQSEAAAWMNGILTTERRKRATGNKNNNQMHRGCIKPQN
jgi:hypothetical protein